MAEAGRRGATVRSDCWVRFEPGEVGIELTSKVEVMYGAAIRAQAEEVLSTLGATAGRLTIEDFGALPFTLGARIETALRRAGLRVARPWLPRPADTEVGPTTRDRMRRSRLYLPGNEPKFMINAALHGPDGVILDLEDSVAPTEKDAARVLVRNALVALDFGPCERMVRINQGEAGLEDLQWVVPYGVHVILVPKCEDPGHLRRIAARIEELAPRHPVYLMPIVESALGCMRAFEIATATPSVVALAIGLEDYTADIGAQRTLEARESFWARSVVVNAARAAGVQPIDTVFSDVDDTEGLRKSVLEAKALGFEGKGCIHPRQVPVVHEAFLPGPKEIERATQIVAAFEEAESQGLGVVSLGSKMIDPPVVKRALATVRLALAAGRLDADWRCQVMRS
jgi:citrate lyase subunit beta/citryl-CoA lyase